jgi:hypothetical protein
MFNSKVTPIRLGAAALTWLSWVLISGISGLIALSFAAEVPPFLAGVIPSGDEANSTGYTYTWAVILAGLLTGGTLGGFEWLFIRRPFAGQIAGGWWVGVSVVAVGVSFTLAWAIGGGMSGARFAHHGLPHAVDLTGIWGGLLIGATLGLAQWLLLWFKLPTEQFRLKRLWGWWVMANLAGFGVGWWVAALMSAPFERAFGPWNHLWGGAVFGTVFGGLTGIVIAKLAARPGRKPRGFREAGK